MTKKTIETLAEKIDSMASSLAEHIKSSEQFRETVTKHGVSLGWIQVSIYGIFAFLGSICIALVYYFAK